MKKTGPTRVAGLWISPAGDRAEGCLVVTDGREIGEVEQVEVLPLSETDRTALAAGGHSAARVAEDAAGALFERMDRVDVAGFQGPVLAFRQGQVLEEAGSGAVLASAFGCPVVWDMLRADFDLGGVSVLIGQAEYAAALMRHRGQTGPVVYLTLDSRAQAIWVDGGQVVLAQETGPGTGLLDLAGHASGGEIAPDVPERFISDGFFTRMGPRAASTDLSDRAALFLDGCDPATARATAAGLVAAGVLMTLAHGPFEPAQIVMAGPGSAEPDLRRMLVAGLDCPVVICDDAVPQAVATAFVAARILRGLPVSGPVISGVPTAMSAAEISRA